MSQHKEITIPLALLIPGIVLPNLLPDLGVLNKIFPAGPESQWAIPAIKAFIGIIILLFPYFIYQRFVSKKNYEQQSELFKATLEIIKAQTRITLDMVDEYKTLFDRSKHFIKPAQKEAIERLIFDLGDVRIYDQELRCDMLSSENRQSLVVDRRKALNRIEKMEPTINKYLREIT